MSGSRQLYRRALPTSSPLKSCTLAVVRLEIYRRKRYTVFAEGYNGRGFTMVEDHLKQTQRLYEVIVRSAFLYEVPVRSALQRVALNDL